MARVTYTPTTGGYAPGLPLDDYALFNYCRNTLLATATGAGSRATTGDYVTAHHYSANATTGGNTPTRNCRD